MNTPIVLKSGRIAGALLLLAASPVQAAKHASHPNPHPHSYSYSEITNCDDHTITLSAYWVPKTHELRGRVAVTTQGLDPVDEDCALSFMPGGEVSCEGPSFFIHFRSGGGSYVIPAGHHDPLTVQCEGGPYTPPPSGFSAGN